MLKFLEKPNELAIFSFLFATIVPLSLNIIEYLNFSRYFPVSVLADIFSLSPFLAVIFGTLALVTISFKYIKNRELNRKMRTGIILSILGIFIGGFYGLLIIGMAGSL